MTTEENKQPEAALNTEELSFLSLIYSLSQAAWSWLGKQNHPVSNKIEQDLAQAKSMIDMLRVLQQKTQGNLSGKEQELLDNILSDLEICYVEESNKKKSTN